MKVPITKYAGVILAMAFVASVFFGTMASAQSATSVICNLLTQVEDVIFILALALMILGGSLYAAANIMPSQQKGAIQGYGMGMIIGGVIGLIIVIMGPYILNLLISNSSVTSNVSAICGTLPIGI
jgi:hypothetical protein